ncbi:MAG: hypothetical protein QM726_19385 [Chitinophagaceae bacterium]
MKNNTKRTLGAIILFLSSFIYFFLAYGGFKEQNINLNGCSKIESVIIDKGLDYRIGSKGVKSQCFYIRLKDYHKKLGVYRMRKNYSDLLLKFNTGDTVTVYYRNNKLQENINIDLVQVEKAGKILLDKKEYEKKESSLIYIGLIGGVFSIVLSYLYYKRKINRH